MKPERTINKNVILWALYNFANTPITVAMGGLYLAQWVVLDNKLNDIWYGSVFTLSTILLLITSPFFGAWSDKIGKRMPFLKWCSIILLVLSVVLGFVSTSSLEKMTRVYLVLFIYFLLQYTYQISLIFHNALLDKLSTRKTRGTVSGISEMGDELGWLISSAGLMPFSLGIITLFGEPGRAQVFFPSAIVLLLLGFPMLLWFKEPVEPASKQNVDFKLVYQETIEGLKNLFKNNKNVALFLTAFMLVSDALLTASLYYAIYLDRVFKITDVQKLWALVLVQSIAVVSAYVSGKFGDRLGIKKIMITACLNLTIGYTAVSLTTSLFWLYFFSAFVGYGYGGFYTASRALLVNISPHDKLGEYFGFYSTFQKFASILGPLSWGGVVYLFKSYGDSSYRIGILSLCFLMAVGSYLMFKVKEKPNPVAGNLANQ